MEKELKFNAEIFEDYVNNCFLNYSIHAAYNLINKYQEHDQAEKFSISISIDKLIEKTHSYFNEISERHNFTLTTTPIILLANYNLDGDIQESFIKEALSTVYQSDDYLEKISGGTERQKDQPLTIKLYENDRYNNIFIDNVSKFSLFFEQVILIADTVDIPIEMKESYGDEIDIFALAAAYSYLLSNYYFWFTSRIIKHYGGSFDIHHMQHLERVNHIYFIFMKYLDNQSNTLSLYKKYNLANLFQVNEDKRKEGKNKSDRDKEKITQAEVCKVWSSEKYNTKTKCVDYLAGGHMQKFAKSNGGTGASSERALWKYISNCDKKCNKGCIKNSTASSQ